MPQTPVSEDTTMGYQAPVNTQFSVFLANKCGKLLELVKIFDGQALQVASLSVVDAADHAVVRLITSRNDLARRLLQRNKMPFSEADILVVEVKQDQTMTALCQTLLTAEINIHYVYPLMVRPHGQATLAIHCDNMTFAGQILRRKMFTLLGENDLGENATPSDPSEPSEN